MCEYFEECSKQIELTETIQKDFCEENSLRCARFMIFQALGSDEMPADLLPADKATAYGIIAGS